MSGNAPRSGDGSAGEAPKAPEPARIWEEDGEVWRVRTVRITINAGRGLAAAAVFRRQPVLRARKREGVWGRSPHAALCRRIRARVPAAPEAAGRRDPWLV